MLTIVIPEQEHFDETENLFTTIKETTLRMEHSLISISKWESKWKLPFLSEQTKTNEQLLDYIKSMTITKDVKPVVFECLSTSAHLKIKDYIDDSMTATIINDTPSAPGSGLMNKENVVTAEIIYYWMVTFRIPFECQKWHVNKLLTLIKVCSIKNANQNTNIKKMSRAEILHKNRELNEIRKNKIGSSG